MSRLKSVKNSRYMRTFGSRKYEGLIDKLGSSMVASACSGEAIHTELKQAWRHRINKERLPCSR